MPKIIIGIHGLGNKPPKDTLTKWWKDSINEGLKNSSFNLDDFEFDLCYWADILHENPLDPEGTDSESENYLSEPYSPFEKALIKEEPSFRNQALEYIEKYSDKIFVSGVMSLNIPSLTDMFIHKHFKDLEVYYSLSFINYKGKKRLAREVILERLTDLIIKHKNKEILLAAHSMGSIIAYDVLMDYLPDDVKINTLITIGSPLAQKYVITKINSEKNCRDDCELPVPEKISYQWFNHYDLEDVVAINNNLADYFLPNSNGVSVVDVMVKNNYSYNGKNNPHKSYGYLRTKEFAEVLNSFLSIESGSIMNWIRNKLKFMN
ncbi:MAG: hypothetical protein HND52_14595 [Ignavibacteriae bacterium]|jgi:hypothetical protein|nr:hypothetical protein [Ignavibacteriota bacterium]NOG99183.1 hypothetical protein [Ignavibacteriota bacterium]